MVNFTERYDNTRYVSLKPFTNLDGASEFIGQLIDNWLTRNTNLGLQTVNIPTKEFFSTYHLTNALNHKKTVYEPALVYALYSDTIPQDTILTVSIRETTY